MTTDQLYQSLEVAFDGQPFSARWRPGLLVEYLTVTFQEFISKFNLDELDDATKQAIFDTVKRFYDNVIRPMDIPYIPNFVEGYVEDAVWKLVEVGIKEALGL